MRTSSMSKARPASTKMNKSLHYCPCLVCNLTPHTHHPKKNKKPEKRVSSFLSKTKKSLGSTCRKCGSNKHHSDGYEVNRRNKGAKRVKTLTPGHMHFIIVLKYQNYRPVRQSQEYNDYKLETIPSGAIVWIGWWSRLYSGRRFRYRSCDSDKISRQDLTPTEFMKTAMSVWQHFMRVLTKLLAHNVCARRKAMIPKR